MSKAAEARYRKKNRERLNAYTKQWRLENLEKWMHGAAKRRAKKKGLDFTIEVEDIVIPNFCPVLGIPLKPSTGKLTGNSPSLDRIRNNEGYVKGNIIVVSYKANTVKSNATVEELRKIAEFYGKLGV